MRLLITGGTGYVGQFILAEASAAGDSVTLLSRRVPPPTTRATWLPFDLGSPPRSLPQADALVHAAFDHLPGKYRGGEGDDPQGFLQRNLDGSCRLIDAARDAGIARIVFLSSRAVYGAYPPGTVLSEDLTPRPDTLYGRMKLAVERALLERTSSLFCTISLRSTGVYGAPTPDAPHKWQNLFDAFQSGTPIPPRRATEVAGADLAQAVRICLTLPPDLLMGRCFNVSDLLLDRADLLSLYAAATGARGTRPPRDTKPAPNVMDCTALRALGWIPGGHESLSAFLKSLSNTT